MTSNNREILILNRLALIADALSDLDKAELIDQFLSIIDSAAIKQNRQDVLDRLYRSGVVYQGGH